MIRGHEVHEGHPEECDIAHYIWTKLDIRKRLSEKMERELDEAARASRLHCMSNLPWKEVRLHGSCLN